MRVADREERLRDATTYLTLLREIESSGEVDERRLESEIETLYAASNTSPDIRVEIMTIHGAKGLEFDSVILPGLNRRTDMNRPQLLNWRERVIGDHRDLLLGPMEPVGANENNFTTISKYITLLGQECAIEESKRLLYVAATRARERLYLVTTMPEHDKAPENGSMFSLLPEEVIAQFPVHADLKPEEENPERVPNVMRRLAAGWVLPAAPPPIAFVPRYQADTEAEMRKHTFVRVGEDLRRIGTVTHRLLQQIGESAELWTEDRIVKAAPAIRALLLQEGVRQSELNIAARRVSEALRKTLADERGRWILQRHSSAANEYALSATLGSRRQNIKVDRTFVEDGKRWLIDYKTSDREGTITEAYLQEQVEKYRADLERYAEILHELDGLPVQGGLYFPLLQRWCEVTVVR
jgi:ATP-dependent exoDNAse (exonuclease V) beta subunit